MFIVNFLCAGHLILIPMTTLLFAHYYPSLKMEGPNSTAFSSFTWICVATYNRACPVQFEFYISNG